MHNLRKPQKGHKGAHESYKATVKTMQLPTNPLMGENFGQEAKMIHSNFEQAVAKDIESKYHFNKRK
jgi:hypothetical protein